MQRQYNLWSQKKGPVSLIQPPQLGPQGLVLANQMLAELAALLKLDSLKFDAKNTCVIDYGGKCTVLITYDASTERIYIYSTLLSSLPSDPEEKLQLYEYLLEGSLLGRDMAGGGVGVSLKDDFCLMCTSFDVRNSEIEAMRTILPPFVASLLEWRRRLSVHPALKNAERNRAPAPLSRSISPTKDLSQTQTSTGLRDGNSRALIIGCNYYSTAVPLKGCTDDARHMEQFLKDNNFTSSLVLTDDGADPKLWPTKENILQGMQWLVSGSHDSLFFVFVGHGRKEQQFGVADEQGNPIFTNSIVPLDYNKYGCITEAEIYDILIAQSSSPSFVRQLSCLIDCTSGCVLDLGLPYVYAPSEGDSPDVKMAPNRFGRPARRQDTAIVLCISSTFDGNSAEVRAANAYLTSLGHKGEQSLFSLMRSLTHRPGHRTGKTILASLAPNDLSMTYML